MHSTISLRVLLVCFCLTYYEYLFSQPELHLYTDVGTTNVSQGYFLKSATVGKYSFGKNQIETGFLFNLKNNNENTLSGLRALISRDLKVRQRPFKLQGFLLQKTYSDILRETNWGALAKFNTDHFDVLIGTNFRTYAYRDEAINVYHIKGKFAKIHEPYNLMYEVSYNLKPPAYYWNLGISVTNIDKFKITQETNPLFNLHGQYKISQPIYLVTQIWYEPAGIFNIYANYFGFFVRTGIIWNLN